MDGARAVAWVFTLLFLAIALYTGARLRSPQGTNRRSDIAHLVMSLGMVAALWPLGDPMPPMVLVVLFAALAAVLLVLRLSEVIRRVDVEKENARAGVSHCERRGHATHHAVSSIVMVYMLLRMGSDSSMSMGLPMNDSMADMPGMAGMAGMANGAAISAVTALLIAYMWGYALYRGVRLSSLLATSPTVTGRRSVGTSVLAAPSLSGACDIIMGIGMGYMLLMMV